jgi:hypothetical protein
MKTFYYNEKTKETVWEKPEGAKIISASKKRKKKKRRKKRKNKETKEDGVVQDGQAESQPMTSKAKERKKALEDHRDHVERLVDTVNNADHSDIEL